MKCSWLIGTLAMACFSKPAPSTGGPDANGDAVIDTSAVSCPGAFTESIPSSTSRYLFSLVGAPFDTHYQACNAYALGKTHLVVLETAAELAELRAILPGPNGFFIGAVQPDTEGQLGSGWLLFNGAPLPPELWEAGQPDDNGDGESGEENVALIAASVKVNDTFRIGQRSAICECDGVPVAANVDALVD